MSKHKLASIIFTAIVILISSQMNAQMSACMADEYDQTTIKDQAKRAESYFQDKLSFEISSWELHQEMTEGKKFQIVDVRDKSSYQNGHVPGALNISLSDLRDGKHKLRHDTLVVLYSYHVSCMMSSQGALYLAKQGYMVKEIRGGWLDWISPHVGEILPVEKNDVLIRK